MKKKILIVFGVVAILFIGFMLVRPYIPYISYVVDRLQEEDGSNRTIQTFRIDEFIEENGLVLVSGIEVTYLGHESAEGNLEIVEYQIVKDPTGEWREGKDTLLVRVKNNL